MQKDYLIKPSNIEGKGLFATRDFKIGEKLNISNSSNISESKIYNDIEFEDFITWCKENSKQWDSISLGNGKHQAAIADRDNHPENYINHSCEPNLDKNHIALRNIKSGEELTIDYGQFSSINWSMNCNCGAKSCKGIIKGSVR